MAGNAKEWRVGGLLHREDGPAKEYPDGSKEWWCQGRLHREDGPAVETADGRKEWWIRGRLHREDGPAVVYIDGVEEYWVDNHLYSKEVFDEKFRIESVDGQHWRLVATGQLHRIAGPAVVSSDGTEEWLFRGELHRLDGPAVTWKDGTKYWAVFGHTMTEQEFQAGIKEDKSISWVNDRGDLHRESGPAYISAHESHWIRDGKLHREVGDGPAIVSKDIDGNSLYEWWFRGQLHRDGGPAVITSFKEVWYQHGKRHRDDGGPAVILSCGTKYWYQHDRLHREDGPAEVCDIFASWWKHGKRHREDGPAVFFKDGSCTKWFKDGVLHRVGGPALCRTDMQAWYENGELHREDGPAVIYADKREEYWIRGQTLSKDEFRRRNLLVRVAQSTKRFAQIDAITAVMRSALALPQEADPILKVCLPILIHKMAQTPALRQLASEMMEVALTDVGFRWVDLFLKDPEEVRSMMEELEVHWEKQ